MTSSVGSTNDLKPESLSRVNFISPTPQKYPPAGRCSPEQRIDNLLERVERCLAAQHLTIDEESGNAVDAEFVCGPVADRHDILGDILVLEASLEGLAGEAGKLGDLEQPLLR